MTIAFLKYIFVLLILLGVGINFGVPSATANSASPSPSSPQIVTTDLSQNQSGTALPTEASDPIVYDNNVYVAWNALTNTDQVFFASSHNDGLNFTSPLDLSDNTTATDFAPRIAAYGSNVYVTWLETTNSNISLMFASSNNEGNNFSSPVTVDSIGSTDCVADPTKCDDIWLPQIAGVSKAIYLLWSIPLSPNHDAIFFSASRNNGTTFGPRIDLTSGTSSGQEPYLVAEGKYVYVTWDNATIYSHSNSDCFIRVSQNYGKSFGGTINVANSGGSSGNISVEPIMSASNDNVYVVWKTENLKTNNWDAFISVSHNNGLSFSAPTNLSNDSGVSREVTVSSWGNDVYVAWRDNTNGSYDVYFRESYDSGNTFTATTDISGNTNITNLSTLGDRDVVGSRGPDVYVSWDSVNSGNYVVYLAYSSNFGATFNTIRISGEYGISDEGLLTPLTSVKGTTVLLESNSSIFFDYVRVTK